MYTLIENMSSRGLICQRSLWYFKDHVTEKRRAEELARAEVARQRQITALNRTVGASIPQVVRDNPPLIQPYDPLHHGCYRPCDADCNNFRAFNPQPAADDGWRGCPVAGCLRWYCAKKTCQGRLTKHIPACLRHKTMREAAIQIRNAALVNSNRDNNPPQG